uniref:Yip1 domain family, member 2 n=1 Tax=Astyanax mexicanus TaxID=7994 RepID=A0A8B9GTJ7_ASTMX
MASPDDLRFQEFEEATDLLAADPGASTLSITNSSTTAPAGHVKLDLSDDEENQQESSELLGGEKQSGGFWTFEYYQSFFNVDTMQVLDRIKASVMPLPGRNFVKHHIRNNPDLYGPFWICATLVFSVAISGNLSTFLSEMGNPRYHYRPHFHRDPMLLSEYLRTGYTFKVYVNKPVIFIIDLKKRIDVEYGMRLEIVSC